VIVCPQQETSCCEVQGSGGDWILYFLTEQAIAEFLDTLYKLRPELEQVGDCHTITYFMVIFNLLSHHCWKKIQS
jgi:hypothetical protein